MAFNTSAWLAFGLGLVSFLGLHSVRMMAPDWRVRQRAQWGPQVWRAAYSLVALLSFGLMVWGYSELRHGDAALVQGPEGWRRVARHLMALLLLPAFWLLAAAFVPRNHLKAALGHPMTLAVKVWAIAHLLVNHGLSDVLLFGSFLLWSVLLFRNARRRPIADSAQAPTWQATALTVVIGTAAYLAFALWAHARWIGVAPFSSGS